jgi:isopenicillin-N N-acyltransferase-like protein
MLTPTFRELTISGPPAERGYAHGAALASEIEAMIDYYAAIFQKPSAEILERASHFRRVIHAYNPAFCEEIDGIAAGARIKEPLWVYALNARSEILSFDAAADVNECTAISFQPTTLLGQTWDWARRLEELVVLMQIELSPGHTIRMLTEPGIIGKIGLNSHGLGVCLNILRINKPLDGVPIHIVLRAVLESRTLDDARLAIQKAGQGKASNILCGDQDGNCYDVEFAGDESFLIQPFARFMIHTNHYLARPINPDEGNFRSSYTRLRVANSKTSALTDFSVEAMQTILADRSDCEFPICRPYIADADLQELGTVATIIMDLKARQLHIRRGNIRETLSDSGAAANQSLAENLANEYIIAFESGDQCFSNSSKPSPMP